MDNLESLKNSSLYKKLSKRNPLLGDKGEKFVKEMMEKYKKGIRTPEVEEKWTKMEPKKIPEDKTVKIEASVKNQMETLLGRKIGDVTIHVGDFAQEVAEEVDARAFTIGKHDIFIPSSQFKPTTPAGKALIAHELTHTTQPQPAVAPSQKKDYQSRVDAEREAKFMEELVFALEEQAIHQQEIQQTEIVEEVYEDIPQEELEHQLEKKVWDIMKSISKRSHERVGNF